MMSFSCTLQAFGENGTYHNDSLWHVILYSLNHCPVLLRHKRHLQPRSTCLSSLEHSGVCCNMQTSVAAPARSVGGSDLSKSMRQLSAHAAGLCTQERQRTGLKEQTCMRLARPMPACAMSPSPPISLDVSTMTTRLSRVSDSNRAISLITVVFPTPGRPCTCPPLRSLV